jgi:hypothetical protein
MGAPALASLLVDHAKVDPVLRSKHSGVVLAIELGENAVAIMASSEGCFRPCDCCRRATRVACFSRLVNAVFNV